MLTESKGETISMLFPQNTSTRLCLSLDGLWNFALIPYGTNYDASAPLQGGRLMPVPGAYNDIYEGREIRDHVGEVVYERQVDRPPHAQGQRLRLHFGSVTHKCRVYWNGVYIGGHEGGFLPFELDVTEAFLPGSNRLTVVADNVVDHSTLPCGTLEKRQYPGLAEAVKNFPNFDYFNYSGIMRPVVLCVLPEAHVEAVEVQGDMEGTFSYKVQTEGKGDVSVRVLKDGQALWTGKGAEGSGQLKKVLCWCPETPALYDLEITVATENGVQDVYTERFGFRTVEVRDCALLLNGKPVYLKGFGKHEDSPVLGRGYSLAYNVKDLSLMQWMGSNSFRTSHYPYSDEMMRLCDEMGILVIDETPAVGMHTTFTATGMKVDVTSPTWQTLRTANHHRQVMEEMIARDKNHPCVIMWSVANEPASEEAGAHDYFAPLFDLARELDPQHRPVTFVTHCEATVETCEVAALCDVIMLNRYYGWYSEEGDIPAAKALLSDELDRYHARYPQKPIMLGEFGADAVAGLHDTTPLMFSEEFQKEMIEAYCQVLDEKEYVCGEHVWNFADFATAEAVKRVQGNKKGVFTRERKPKAAVWYLKDRWTKKV